MATPTSTISARVGAVADLGIDVTALARVIGELDAALEPEAATTVISADGDRAGIRARVADPARALAPWNWAASLAILFARPGERWLRVEAQRARPDAVDVTGELVADGSVGDALELLATSGVDAPTRERLAGLLRGLGDRWVRITDQLGAPEAHTRTVWVRAGADIADRAAVLADALQILPAHRAALLEHLGIATPIAIGVRTTSANVLPEVHVVSWAGPRIAARMLGIDLGDQAAIVEAVYRSDGQPSGTAWATTEAAPARPVDPAALLDLAVVSARVGTAASTLKLDARPLISSLSRVASSLDGRVRVTMPAEADRLAVRVRWPDEPVGRAAVDEWLAARRATDQHRAIERRGHASIELGTGGDLWLHADGDVDTTGRDLELAGAPQLRRGFAALGNASHGASRMAGRPDARIHARLDAAAALPAITAAAEVLAIAPRQRALIADIHRLLVRRPQVIVSLSSSAAGEELWIAYPDVSWQTAVRVIVPVLPGRDPGLSLGHLAGALGAADVASLVLVLRRQDPLRVLVAVDLRAGAAR